VCTTPLPTTTPPSTWSDTCCGAWTTRRPPWSLFPSNPFHLPSAHRSPRRGWPARIYRLSARAEANQVGTAAFSTRPYLCGFSRPTALLCGEGLARRRQDGGGFRLLCIKAKCDIGSGCEAGRRRLGFWHRGAAVGSHIHLATADLARQVDLPVLRKELDLKWEMSVCKDGCYNRTFNVSGTR
jgi:hypothetical protein